ncbi:MAG TPA: SRPBCC domain-containing protein [Thermoanaerobaculia bacterium]|nr:SRPBCC domain-containing protein [Thermoanaerobaculia bacterium]
MADQEPGRGLYRQDATLVVRKLIAATPERLFTAWTAPEHLKQWWGPPSVTCTDAEVDLRVGGGYRIANRFPDGTVVWIAGEFEAIDPPHKLVYTWRIEPQSHTAELVTVLFEARPEGATEVIVIHERIPDKAARETHEQGWEGCLEGLAEYVSGE